ncbi:TANK-binding kinase 1-binding protein 1-like [Engraulis encrasicolus]|uniref:TANK-binding kinase 1-binding protein 1-like n=1 Tax=Engraulis encrasicolus TaxID=184585 RepID=UPI002FD18C4F
MKHLITDNTGPKGKLDTNSVQKAILHDHNTPDPDTKICPAMCLFGRPIQDFIPIPPGKYRPHATWRETLTAREEALRKRHIRTAENWAEHTKRLPPLKVGDFVRMQNQTGLHPNKWDRTGRVVEVRQHDQYVVKTDGSGRVSLRNRRFLRRFLPVRNDQILPRSIHDDLAPRVATPTPVAVPLLPAPLGSPATTPGPSLPSGVALSPPPPAGNSSWQGGLPSPHAPAPSACDGPCASPLTPATPAVPRPPQSQPSASPASGLRRSARTPGVPAWHKDFIMD